MRKVHPLQIQKGPTDMKKKTQSVYTVGISSIFIIFILLSFVSFATLSLMTARSDMAMSKQYAERVQAYYEARNEAVSIWNEKNRNPQDETVSYQIPVSESQQLCVTLDFSEETNTYKAVEWKIKTVSDWEADDTLNLFPGKTASESS